ncbi:MAG: hypothetical protein GY795_11850 [Desulfobacterales bacterium]|nr:hypothetical protein [Desulfobacterales bacterium]
MFIGVCPAKICEIQFTLSEPLIKLIELIALRQKFSLINGSDSAPNKDQAIADAKVSALQKSVKSAESV